MKKFIAVLLAFNLMAWNIPALALNYEESAHLRDMRVQPEDPENAPKWVDYVPDKYENPRTDFNRGKARGELIVGIVLTDLLITSPIGIPMICHGTTKLKNISYAEKKEKYFQGLEEAKEIPVAEQEEYYNKLLKKCKMKKQKEDK